VTVDRAVLRVCTGRTAAAVLAVRSQNPDAWTVDALATSTTRSRRAVMHAVWRLRRRTGKRGAVLVRVDRRPMSVRLADGAWQPCRRCGQRHAPGHLCGVFR
jgi:hypothetical protein